MHGRAAGLFSLSFGEFKTASYYVTMSVRIQSVGYKVEIGSKTKKSPEKQQRKQNDQSAEAECLLQMMSSGTRKYMCRWDAASKCESLTHARGFLLRLILVLG